MQISAHLHAHDAHILVYKYAYEYADRRVLYLPDLSRVARNGNVLHDPDRRPKFRPPSSRQRLPHPRSEQVSCLLGIEMVHPVDRRHVTAGDELDAVLVRHVRDAAG